MRKSLTWSAAVVLLAAGFAAAEESAWTLLEKGIAEFQKGRMTRAQQILDAAVRMDARCEDAWYYLGRIHEQRGDTREAIAAYKKITPQFPTHSLAAERLGHLAMRAGDKEAALGHYQVFADARPTTPALMQLASLQIELKKFEDAEASLKKAAEMSKGDLDVTELFGRLYLESDRPGEALDAYTKICDKIPADTTAQYMRAVCLQRLDRGDEAVAAMEKILEKDPYHGMSLRALVTAYGDDPSKEVKVKDYLQRLRRLAKSKPAPPRPVKSD